MLVSEIADRVKRQFGDESGVQVTDTDILRWVNDAQKDIVTKHNLLQKRGTLPTVIGQQDYGVPADMFALHSVKYDNYLLDHVQIQEADLTGLARITESGTPTRYTFFAEILTLYPTPDAVANMTILYTQHPVAVTTTADSLTIPAQYENLVVQFCLQQAYEMDENWQAANQKSQQYTNDMAELRGKADEQPEEFYPFITYVSRNDWEPW